MSAFDCGTVVSILYEKFPARLPHPSPQYENRKKVREIPHCYKSYLCHKEQN
jgi:hypothetical protein